MNIKEAHFKFTALLKNDQDIMFDGQGLFPGMSEISFASRTFPSYAECVKSCKQLMEDMVQDINSKIDGRVFKSGSENNPLHSGVKTLSVDWREEELSRFWIYNREMEGTGKISAICKASIIAVERQEPNQTFN